MRVIEVWTLFAADIRAYLDGYPVSARPPSWRYLIGKWMQRHRIATSLSALALIAILASSVIALRQAHQADQARRQAQENLERLKVLRAPCCIALAIKSRISRAGLKFDSDDDQGFDR